MFVRITAENGFSSHVRAESFVDAISYFQRCHPDLPVQVASKATSLKVVLEGCYDNAEEQLRALLEAIYRVDDTGKLQRQLQEAVYCDCVGTECAEFTDSKEVF